MENMNDVMGVVYTSKDDFSLRELANHRAVAAIPVAGRYRIIDFTISNLVNSGIRNVGIIAQRNYHSLMDHLGSGKEWDLHTRNNGLFILPPFLTGENSGEYSGVLEALKANFDYLRRSRQEYVILTDSDYIMNTSFEPMIKQHIKSGADITMLYKKVASPESVGVSSSRKKVHAYLAIDEAHNVVDMEVNPNAATMDNLYLNVLMIKRTMLIYLVDQALSHGSVDLCGDVLRHFVKASALKIMGYEEKGYYRRIETILNYFNFNMDLLDYNVRKELFSNNPVYTKTRDSAPTVYREGAQVRNSLIADDCVIEGSVENCILSRGVHVAAHAKLTNCVVLQDSYIDEFVELENVILDKAVTIRSHGRLIGQKQYPIVIAKNTTL